jgi:hypothetical protein
MIQAVLFVLVLSFVFSIIVKFVLGVAVNREATPND